MLSKKNLFKPVLLCTQHPWKQPWKQEVVQGRILKMINRLKELL